MRAAAARRLCTRRAGVLTPISGVGPSLGSVSLAAGLIGDDAGSCRMVDGGHGRTASRPVDAERPRGLGLAEGSSFLEKLRDLGVGDELRPPRLVHVEQPPDAA